MTSLIISLLTISPNGRWCLGARWIIQSGKSQPNLNRLNLLWKIRRKKIKFPTLWRIIGTKPWKTRSGSKWTRTKIVWVSISVCDLYSFIFWNLKSFKTHHWYIVNKFCGISLKKGCESASWAERRLFGLIYNIFYFRGVHLIGQGHLCLTLALARPNFTAKSSGRCVFSVARREVRLARGSLARWVCLGFGKSFPIAILRFSPKIRVCGSKAPPRYSHKTKYRSWHYSVSNPWAHQEVDKVTRN